MQEENNLKPQDEVIKHQQNLANNVGKKPKKHIIPVGNTDEFPEDENAHIIGSNTFVSDVAFDDKFEYLIKSPVKRFFASCLWFSGILLLSIVNALVFGFYVKNTKYIKKVRKSKKGAITIANHCMMMDCVMCCQANWPKMSYLPTLHTTFQLPYVRHIVHWLNAFPIPNTPSGTKKFVEVIDTLLKRGKFVHFFPEASLWPWYDRIRNFKPGAFNFACRNDVPVIPLAVEFRPRKLTKFIKRPKIRIEVLEPIYPNKDLKGKAQVNDILNRAHDAMNATIVANNLKYYGVKSTKVHLD